MARGQPVACVPWWPHSKEGWCSNGLVYMGPAAHTPLLLSELLALRVGISVTHHDNPKGALRSCPFGSTRAGPLALSLDRIQVEGDGIPTAIRSQHQDRAITIDGQHITPLVNRDRTQHRRVVFHLSRQLLIR